MRWLHFDSMGGASGDMILGALIELGVSADTLSQALAALPVEDIHLHVEAASDRGIHGTRVTVHAHEVSPTPHDHEHHNHDHDHGHTHDDHAHHHHHDLPSRNLHDIQHIIEQADLPEPVKQASRTVFERIGVAEAKIHGTTVDKIHFHEVGALDSIADIIGCCLALHLLKVDGLSVSPLPMGHGVIQCAHGTYPNPAPATVELLTGMTTCSVDEPYELVTPTGAALLSTWKTSETPPNGSRVVKAAYSFGHRKLNDRPNVLRATLYERADDESTPDTCLSLACNLDDTTPELIGALTERLFRAGALDVYTTPIQMKKQRPGTLLTVLCRLEDRDPMLNLLFLESTTFGVRETAVQRSVLDRRSEKVTTPYGDIRIKVGIWQGHEITHAPEMDDCMACAEAHNVSVRTVYDAAKRATSPR